MARRYARDGRSTTIYTTLQYLVPGSIPKRGCRAVTPERDRDALVARGTGDTAHCEHTHGYIFQTRITLDGSVHVHSKVERWNSVCVQSKITSPNLANNEARTLTLLQPTARPDIRNQQYDKL